MYFLGGFHVWSSYKVQGGIGNKTYGAESNSISSHLPTKFEKWIHLLRPFFCPAQGVAMRTMKIPGIPRITCAILILPFSKTDTYWIIHKPRMHWSIHKWPIII